MKTLMIAAAALFAASLSTSVAAHEFVLQDIQIIHPAVPASPPGATAAPLYMALSNNTDSADRLLGIETPYGPVRFRRPVTAADGTTRFEGMAWIDVPPGGIVVLSQGAMHGVFDIPAPLHEGGEIPVTMVFEARGRVEMHLMIDPVGALDTETSVASGAQAPQAGDVLQVGAALRTALAPTQATIMPIVLHGNHAVAGWSNDTDAARALLRRVNGNWQVEMWSGASLLLPATFVSMGMSQADAEILIAEVKAYESMIDPAIIARFDAFPGTVLIKGDAQ
ncbi:copper uptake system-associated protein [Ketogulonicigenium vulgare]|uniref:copper uptake system-associated protein n=1 Tax=Ketogulonicigenium vulgare TaxID=92945 RepID=UPI00235855B2|nr:copper uptake system-associated protein [Ketogulonicigenium vulgare]